MQLYRWDKKNKMENQNSWNEFLPLSVDVLDYVGSYRRRFDRIFIFSSKETSMIR